MIETVIASHQMDWKSAMSLFPLWPKAFTLTLLFELPIYLFVARYKQNPKQPIRVGRILLGGALCSTITHPFLWFVWRQIVTHYTFYLISGELLVFLAEAVIFYAIARPVTLLRASFCSFFANLSSFCLGMLCYWWGII